VICVFLLWIDKKSFKTLLQYSVSPLLILPALSENVFTNKSVKRKQEFPTWRVAACKVSFDNHFSPCVDSVVKLQSANEQRELLGVPCFHLTMHDAKRINSEVIKDSYLLQTALQSMEERPLVSHLLDEVVNSRKEQLQQIHLCEDSSIISVWEVDSGATSH